jgi:hypothetical protein
MNSAKDLLMPLPAVLPLSPLSVRATSVLVASLTDLDFQTDQISLTDLAEMEMVVMVTTMVVMPTQTITRTDLTDLTALTDQISLTDQLEMEEETTITTAKETVKETVKEMVTEDLEEITTMPIL